MFTIIENVLTQQEVAEFLDQMQKSVWIEGAKTAGNLAKNVKQNLQLDDENKITKTLSQRLEQRLMQSPDFISKALPNVFYPPKFNLYQDGGFYGAHVDSAVLTHPYNGKSIRADLSATLFLNQPDSYQGGELQIDTGMGVQEIKLKAGDMILYSSGALHQVLPVTAGQRIASFMWIQSLIKNDYQRTLLNQLDESIQGLRQHFGVQSQDTELLQLSELYHNLLRLWSET